MNTTIYGWVRLNNYMFFPDGNERNFSSLDINGRTTGEVIMPSDPARKAPLQSLGDAVVGAAQGSLDAVGLGGPSTLGGEKAKVGGFLEVDYKGW